MDNAIWNGKLIRSYNVAKEYITEKEMRKASARKELRCPDLDCKSPILKYCHGEKKDAYFSHVSNEHCDYAIFDRYNTQSMRSVRNALYNHFITNGYSVHTEVKILDHHYTHLLFDMENGHQVAIEIGTRQMSALQMDALTEEYRTNGIALNWIVLDNTDILVKERQTFFIKRFLLNESPQKDLLVVSCDGKIIAQYKSDPNTYACNGKQWENPSYPETYINQASLNQLILEMDVLTLTGFSARYAKWIDEKRSAFDDENLQRKAERKEESIAFARRELERRRNQEQYRQDRNQKIEREESPSFSKAPADIKIPNYTGEVYENKIKQQDDIARDGQGNRIVKCKKCGIISKEEYFVQYGGKDLNAGICKNCQNFL